jgi:hypothetical protein
MRWLGLLAGFVGCVLGALLFSLPLPLAVLLLMAGSFPILFRAER